jgi:hypothetical protein
MAVPEILEVRRQCTITKSCILIPQNDLIDFQKRHFSTTSANHFEEQFLGPVEESYEEEDEYDVLVYYDDGVKRTLTDEQIAIFRHSEIQALLRDRRHAEEARDSEDGSTPAVEEGEIEEGELEETAYGNREFGLERLAAESLSNHSSNRSSKTKQKSERKVQKAEHAKQKGWFRQTIKPDLRKRTWDKVDSGVGDLDYDEDSGSAPVRNPATQRRRISYDE